MKQFIKQKRENTALMLILIFFMASTKRIFLQVDNEDKYPWIAQLIVKDINFHEDPIYATKCSASLVKQIICASYTRYRVSNKLAKLRRCVTNNTSHKYTYKHQPNCTISTTKKQSNFRNLARNKILKSVATFEMFT